MVCALAIQREKKEFPAVKGNSRELAPNLDTAVAFFVASYVGNPLCVYGIDHRRAQEVTASW